MKYSTFNEDFLIKRGEKKKRKPARGQLTSRRVRVAAGGDEDASEERREGGGGGGEEGRPRFSPELCCIKLAELAAAAAANAAGVAPLFCFYFLFLDVL